MKIRRIDVMFVLGAGLVIGEAIKEVAPDRAVIIAGLVLMGVPVFSRIGGNGGK